METVTSDSVGAPPVSVASIARLATRLGIAYADAIESTLQRHKLDADLAGCHGQTIYHQGITARYLGKRVATTWQLLDAAPVSERLRTPVVTDFRPADMAAGGQGAPLVPLLDYEFFRDARRNRVLHNLGGIGNMTVLPAGTMIDHVQAFDTGPANMVIDGLMQQLYGKPYDRDGRIAASGQALRVVVEEFLDEAFFRKPPPKTAGREQFGEEFTRRFLRRCHQFSGRSEDAIASATLLTARSIALALQKFAMPKMTASVEKTATELIVSGGGAKNCALMTMLQSTVAGMNCTVQTSDELGFPAAAKEAVAFALLAWNTWYGLPGNVPSATGARHPAVLGRISPAPVRPIELLAGKGQTRKRKP